MNKDGYEYYGKKQKVNGHEKQYVYYGTYYYPLEVRYERKNRKRWKWFDKEWEDYVWDI